LKAGFLVCLLLIIPLVGTVRRPVPPPRPQSLSSSSMPSAGRALLSARLKETGNVFRAGYFHQAAALARDGYQDALQAGERQIAAQFLGNLGGCRFALHRYQEALRAFLDARDLAESAGARQTAGALDFNISSLYYQLGQMDAAADAANRAMARLSGEDRTQHLPKLLIHLATLRAKQGHTPEALTLFQQGIAAADRANDAEMYALGWNAMGEVYLDRQEFPQAEHALLEAYRVRKLNHLRSLESSYRNLGMLRLAQGDLGSASVLLDEAVERSRRPGGLLPSWQVYEARGRVRLAQNRLREALDDLRIAARLARVWHRAAPLDDATRVSAENAIQSVHSALVEAGNKLYFAAGGQSLAQETFEAAEANRAASLRALLSEPRDWRAGLPPEYWETLSKLETAEVELLRGHGGADKLQQLRGALIQWESRAGSNAGSNAEMEIPDLLDRVQRSLGPDAALLSFHLASPDSYLWAVTRTRFALYRLPPAAEIAALAGRFERAIREGSPEATPAGYRLFRALFSPLSPAIQRKEHWLLALDAQLFELPFAALVVETGADGPVFLAERHSLQTVSGAGMLALAAATPRPALPGPFLGIADPVYNTADPRWQAAAKSADGARTASFLNPFGTPAAASQPADDLHLARLVGSAREVAACAAAWSGPRLPVLLEGAAASRRGVEAALGSHPAVLHFATHVLESRQGFRSGLIVLSLADRGRTEVLTSAEIATWHLDGALVSLSGCSSGSAEALPGTGLMGLTRAWRAAGASAVVASRWPGPDDAGALFVCFYRYLRASPQAGVAVALQHAQMDLLRSHTWRSSPSYWGSYYVTGDQQ
jgi:CHAT domain-containing protein